MSSDAPMPEDEGIAQASHDACTDHRFAEQEHSRDQSVVEQPLADSETPLVRDSEESAPAGELLPWDASSEVNGVQVESGADRGEPAAAFRIIGLGASAGGLAALEELFEQIPGGTGMAFVVVTHLSPDFESELKSILGRRTKMPVIAVTNGIRVEPNHVYVIPPGKEMIISQGRLLLTDTDREEALVMPIDTFLRSLAQDCGQLSAAVILSGSGSDGSRGVVDIHNAGGTVFVQEPATAEFASMPDSAIASTLADHVADPTKLPRLLLATMGPVPELSEGQDLPSDQQVKMQKLLDCLQRRHGIDFSHYKTRTLSRRLARRAEMDSKPLGKYLDEILVSEQKQDIFFQDLLIGVTAFFRDEVAFEKLAETIELEVLNDLPDHYELRAWVAACATGEEAYSVAMILHEQAEKAGFEGEIKVFATDIDRHSLDHAARGRYSSEQMESVNEGRKQRYFELAENGEYQVNSDLRQLLVFARHDVLRDAPFTKTDLVTCRNMLIYLESSSQQKVLSLFHFGLRAKGVLMLGASESIGELEREFRTIDNARCIFQKRRNVSLLNQMRFTAPKSPSEASPIGGDVEGQRRQFVDQQIIAAFESLATQHFPPSFFVSEKFDLLYCTPGANDYLVPRQGRYSANLLVSVLPELRTVFQAALRRAARERRMIELYGVTLEIGKERKIVNVRVVPQTIPSVEGTTYVVSVEQPQVAALAPTVLDNDILEDPENEALRSELQLARESLQGAVHELETSNEELQATNEELTASNEELQSTNEELHSVNEELYTVNVEHQGKIDELSILSEYIENLLQSVDIATMFLDENLKIRKFTKGIGDLFRITENDIGRPLDSFTHELNYPELFKDLQHVMDSGERIEREVGNSEGTRFLARVLPYVSTSAQTGVILSLINLAMIEVERDKLRESEERFRGTFDNAAVGIAHIGMDGRWLRVNQRLCEIVDYSEEELLATDFQHITHPDDLGLDLEKLRLLLENKISNYTIQKRYVKKHGDLVWVNLNVTLQRDDFGGVLYAIAIVQDISVSKRLEAGLEEALEGRDRFLALLSHELRNPLSAVLNAVRVMENTAPDGQLDKEGRVILRQSMQISQLLDDLLDVARITQNKLTLNLERLDLYELVEVGAAAIEVAASQAGHTVTIAAPEGSVWIDGDPTRMLQIIENLLSNAVRYTPPGGEIHILVETDEENAVLSVTDTGKGIAPELMNRIFEMFVQSEDRTHKGYGGLGIGLTLVKALTRMHEGEVSVDSAGTGLGSRFEVRLPRASPPAVTELLEAPVVEARVRPQRIVVVEDQADAREMLTALLELEDHQVYTANDGDKGLEAILIQRPDLALVDIALPGLDGYQIAKQVRATIDSSEVYLVALTGFGGSETRQQILDSGFDDHFVKPIHPDDLAGIMQKLSSQQAAES